MPPTPLLRLSQLQEKLFCPRLRIDVQFSMPGLFIDKCTIRRIVPSISPQFQWTTVSQKSQALEFDHSKQLIKQQRCLQDGKQRVRLRRICVVLGSGPLPMIPLLPQFLPGLLNRMAQLGAGRVNYFCRKFLVHIGFGCCTYAGAKHILAVAGYTQHD